MASSGWTGRAAVERQRRIAQVDILAFDGERAGREERTRARRVHREERRQLIHGEFRGASTASEVDLIQHRERVSIGLQGNVSFEHGEGAIEIAEHASGARRRRGSPSSYIERVRRVEAEALVEGCEPGDVDPADRIQ